MSFSMVKNIQKRPPAIKYLDFNKKLPSKWTVVKTYLIFNKSVAKTHLMICWM